MTLKQAVRILGGTTKAAKMAGVTKANLHYWLRLRRAPAWRRAEVTTILALAANAQRQEAAE